MTVYVNEVHVAPEGADAGGSYSLVRSPKGAPYVTIRTMTSAPLTVNIEEFLQAARRLAPVEA